MQDIFITKINIEKVRHLKNIEIALCDNERKHLILTGKNGSGKTSLLEFMKRLITAYRRAEIPGGTRQYGDDSSLSIKFCSNIPYGSYIFVFFPAERGGKLVVPTGPTQLAKNSKDEVGANASIWFLQHLINMDFMRLAAENDDEKSAMDLKKWFGNFEDVLRYIYDCPSLKLKLDAKHFSHKIEMPNREPFALHEMARGYGALLDIYMELIMRFEDEDANIQRNTSAIVMIDEIETGLHVELQKRALPFLTQMFPNIQFIVSTHSPFIITSLENAIVYDLEKRERIEHPSFYSYQTIVESFLDTNMYSEELKKYFERYKELCFKERTPDENEEFLRAKAELEIMARPSTELFIAFQELEQKRKAAKNGSIN